MEDKEKVTELREEALDAVSGGSGASDGEPKYSVGDIVIFDHPTRGEKEFGRICEAHEGEPPWYKIVCAYHARGGPYDISESNIHGKKP